MPTSSIYLPCFKFPSPCSFFCKKLSLYLAQSIFGSTGITRTLNENFWYHGLGNWIFEKIQELFKSSESPTNFSVFNFAVSLFSDQVTFSKSFVLRLFERIASNIFSSFLHQFIGLTVVSWQVNADPYVLRIFFHDNGVTDSGITSVNISAAGQ